MNETEVKESTTGRFPGQTFETYQAIDATNASTLLALYLTTPAHVITQRETTEAMEFGAALHCLALEPMKFMERYYRIPKLDKRVKKNVETLDELEAANPGKMAVIESDYTTMLRIADKLYSHPLSGPLITSSAHEETLVWEESHGLCKARVDMIGADWIGDLKTTKCAHPIDFSWVVRQSRREYGNLWIQAAWYFRGATALGLPVKDFHFVAIESAAPHCISVHTLEAAELESVQDELTRLAVQWQECVTANNFHGYACVRNIISLGDSDNA